MTPGSGLSSGLKRYQRLRVLGRGSFGEVFEAEDSLLGRTVAIKVLPFAERIPILSRRALLSEAQMAAAAGRSAVQVFDLVDDGSGWWLVMEFVAGGSLSEWAKPDRTESELRTVVSSMAQRLAIMHDLGLTHGDIHPRNLLVRATDDVAYSDFGLARMTRDGSRRRDAHERHWSAPEVLAAGRVSPAADIYSIALVIDWLYRSAGKTPPPATKRALAPSPEERPQDGGAFAQLLLNRSEPNAAEHTSDEAIDSDLQRAAHAARHGNTREAKRTLEKAIRLAPLDPRPRRRLALVRWMSGQRQAAIWALESAQHLDPADRLTATMLRNWRDAMDEA
jgi:serine/threonine protein kinase